MTFWSGETLKDRLPSLIEPFDLKAIDCAAYTLHLGHEVYVSPDREVAVPNRQTKRTLAGKEGFTIPPGQFAFLTTQEVIEIPDTALAFISIKARQKWNGLINISGFHVDPGYRGILIFSVLNAGPRPLHLHQGQALFLIWYADLDRQTQMRKTSTNGIDGIDSKMLNGISGEILSLQSLSEKQRALEVDIADRHRSLEIGVERTLNRQTTELAGLRWGVRILVAIAVGLVGWQLRSLTGTS